MKTLRLLRASATLICLGALALAAGCNRTPQPQLHDSMAQVVVPGSTTMWDVANRAINDNAEPDASKLTDADWANLITASQQVRDRALALAAQKHVVVADPMVKIQDEGGPGASNAKDVQAFIDAKPAVFSQQAKNLAAAADGFLIAAKTKDAAKLAEVSDKLDGVCESCHLQFWYPQQATQQP